jgi:hypothetical protein
MLDRVLGCSGRTIPAALALACGGAACAPPSYMPRPSPRIQVVSEGSSIALVREGRIYRAGTLGGGLVEAVQGNPRAEEEAKSFEKKTTAGFVLSILGAVSVGVSGGILVANQLSRSPSDTLNGASLGLAIGGVTFSLVGSLVLQSAAPHVWNAINIYNDSLPHYGPVHPSQGYSVPGYAPPAYAPPAYAPPAYAPVPQAPTAYPPPAAPPPAAPPSVTPPPVAPVPSVPPSLAPTPPPR